MSKFLVTGGTGFLGNNILRQLSTDGLEVVAAVRESSSDTPFHGIDLEKAVIDFNDEKSIALALEGVQVVIHAAGFVWFGWRKLQQSRDINVEVTRRLAKVCHQKGIRFIHISSLDALPLGRNREALDETAIDNRSEHLSKPPCNYVVSKIEADEVVRQLFRDGLSGCIIHPGLMFGPFDWKPSSGELIKAVSKLGTFFACPTGGISVTDVRAVAKSTIRAAQMKETDGQHFILAGHNVRYQEVCNLIADRCGVGHPRGRTDWIAMAGAAFIGGVTSVFGQETIVNTAAIKMARCWHYYSSAKAEKTLSYQTMDLSTTINDAVDWLDEQGMIKIRRKQKADSE